jgi:hypothetical protein
VDEYRELEAAVAALDGVRGSTKAAARPRRRNLVALLAPLPKEQSKGRQENAAVEPEGVEEAASGLPKLRRKFSGSRVSLSQTSPPRWASNQTTSTVCCLTCRRKERSRRRAPGWHTRPA